MILTVIPTTSPALQSPALEEPRVENLYNPEAAFGLRCFLFMFTTFDTELRVCWHTKDPSVTVLHYSPSQYLKELQTGLLDLQKVYTENARGRNENPGAITCILEVEIWRESWLRLLLHMKLHSVNFPKDWRLKSLTPCNCVVFQCIEPLTANMKTLRLLRGILPSLHFPGEEGESDELDKLSNENYLKSSRKIVLPRGTKSKTRLTSF
jgi:hypothetical protein